jgi:cytochrome P450
MQAELKHATPPMASGLPLIGNTLNMLHDPLQYLTEQYHAHGSVFRINLALREYWIMAGGEANKFLLDEGENVFSSDALFGSLGRQWNTDVLLVMMDGEPHRHMRRILRNGYSRSAAAPHLQAMVDVTREFVAQWQPGDRISVWDQLRRIVTNQLGLVTTGFSVGDLYDDLLLYVNSLLNVEVMKTLPRLTLQRPAFRRARKHILAFGQHVLDYHRENPPEATGRQPDLIDDILAGVRPDGDDFTDDDLLSMTVGPYFAGLDTIASTMAFMMFAVHKHSDVLQRVKAEAHSLFAEGTPQSLNDLRKLKAIHNAALETLRRYPATPFTPRQVTREFEFGGYVFPVGTDVMIAQAVTHMLPEYYDDPLTFNIDRDQVRKPLVFAPFSLGAHTCLGAGLAEAQMALTLATILHEADLELETPDYTVPINTMPLPNPGMNFKLRVLG